MIQYGCSESSQVRKARNGGARTAGAMAVVGAVIACSVISLGAAAVEEVVKPAQAPQAAEPKDAPTPADEPQAAPASPLDGLSYLRIDEVKGQSIALGIASHTFTRPDGQGPTVALVGVAHIGDREFYQALQRHLATFDVVLYESVMPAGAAGPQGSTDEERAVRTESSMKFLRSIIETARAAHSKLPTNLEDVSSHASTRDPRLGQWAAAASKDGWGRALVYEPSPDGASYALRSFGADGAAGGEGAAADIELGPDPSSAMSASEDDQLQGQLADALGLEFQLEAMDYSFANWRCSDMDMDELNIALEAHGADFSLMGGTLAGSSFPGRIIKFMLGAMKMADAFLEGAISDTFKVVMIEMLGDESLSAGALDQLGSGLHEVIVNKRNQVVIDDLATLLKAEPEVKSVAIFYGAAHMADMAKRLHEQLGYQPASSEWHTAMSVDMKASAVSPAELNRIRAMMRQSLRQQGLMRSKSR